MTWLFFTALSILSRSTYGVMTKVLSSKMKVSIYTQACFLPLAGAFLTVIFSPLLGGLAVDFSNASLVLVALVVFGQGLGKIVYFASIKNLTNATAQIAFSSILLFNTVLALLFLHLHLSMINVLGIVLLTLAILSVISGKVAYHKQGVLLMILSAFLFAIFQLSSSELSKQVSSVSYLLVAYLGSATVVFIYKYKVIVQDVIQAADWKSIVVIPILTALPSVGNFLFAYLAYRAAPEAAKVAMLLTSQVVLTVLLSYVFLHEKTNIKRNIIAAASVVLAALFIKS